MLNSPSPHNLTNMENRIFWVIGARNAWDQVVIGPYTTKEAALRDIDCYSSPSIVRKATALEMEQYYNNKAIKNKLT